jgi:hypothetical protein
MFNLKTAALLSACMSCTFMMSGMTKAKANEDDTPPPGIYLTKIVTDDSSAEVSDDQTYAFDISEAHFQKVADVEEFTLTVLKGERADLESFLMDYNAQNDVPIQDVIAERAKSEEETEAVFTTDDARISVETITLKLDDMQQTVYGRLFLNAGQTAYFVLLYPDGCTIKEETDRPDLTRTHIRIGDGEQVTSASAEVDLEEYLIIDSGKKGNETIILSQMDITFENRIAPVPPVEEEKKKTEVSVELNKIWKDEHNRNGIRPDPTAFRQWIHLYQENEDVTDQFQDQIQIIDNGNDTYTVRANHLPEGTYTLKEDTAEAAKGGYQAEISTDGTEVINTEKTVDIQLIKVWKDDGNRSGKRPVPDIFREWIHLYDEQGNELTGTYQDRIQVIDNGDHTYTVTAVGLPQGTYTLKEDEEKAAEAGYSAVYNSDGTMVTNHMDVIEEVPVTGGTGDYEQVSVKTVKTGVKDNRKYAGILLSSAALFVLLRKRKNS